MTLPQLAVPIFHQHVMPRISHQLIANTVGGFVEASPV